MRAPFTDLPLRSQDGRHFPVRETDLVCLPVNSDAPEPSQWDQAFTAGMLCGVELAASDERTGVIAATILAGADPAYLKIRVSPRQMSAARKLVRQVQSRISSK